jgi:hypothetical protein
MERQFVLTAILISFLLVSISVGVQFVKSVKANYFPPWNSEIVIDTPQNATYASGNIALKGSIICITADSGNNCSAQFWLDTKSIDSYESGVPLAGIKAIMNSEGTTVAWYSFYNFTLPLSDLSDGSHIVTVNLVSYRQVSPTTVSFTINTAQPTPLPSSTPNPSPFPIIEPTATPLPQSGFLGTNLPLEYGYAIIAAALIAVVALAVVALRKRYRKSLVNSARATVLQKTG